MSELVITYGEDCLNYIDKPVGFGSHDYIVFGNMPYNDQQGAGAYGLFAINTPRTEGYEQHHSMTYGGTPISTTLMKWTHDTSKRKVGVVLDYSPDGGLEVAILGNESIINSDVNGNIEVYANYITLYGEYRYDTPATPLGEYTLETPREGGYPRYPFDTADGGSGSICVGLSNPYQRNGINFDDAIDYTPEADGFSIPHAFGCIWEYAGAQTTADPYMLTDDKNNTMVFGKIIDMGVNSFSYYTECMENPLNMLAGNLYNALGNLNFKGEQAIPQRIPFGQDFDLIRFPFSETTELTRSNLTALPFNLILTNSEAYAKNYLQNGTLPPDAFLYPLDWDNLPRYDEPIPTADTPENYPDKNTPDDDLRDIDPMPPEITSFSVNQLTNYNWYWLDVSQWADFLNWFWNDIGDYSDFDDIIAKVEGLYNDLSSAVIMCRYYPVEYEWITNTDVANAPHDKIRLGMIEKAGSDVLTIDQSSSLRAKDIGHIHIGEKYESFLDMSPYSQLMLYLPWHGFIDLDVNLFTGHDLYVKGIYDYVSGTLQYLIYYDNEMLVNTVVCKMAMDIPITLQTKNDRDSAIFNNVSNTVSGMIGAGVGIASGNPIGMAIGVTQGVSALNSSNASAPLRLMGTVGEHGAYASPQKCAIIIRRPTIQPSDVVDGTKHLTTWKQNVGILCGYGYQLKQLTNQGFTVCQNPRIDFTQTTPLQTEVDEIYDYLEKGVIL